MNVRHADPLDDPRLMDSLSERNAMLVRCSPKIERCAFWAVAHGADALELLDILEQQGLNVADWSNEPWHTTSLAMLFDQYVATLRLTKLEQVLGPETVGYLAPLLEPDSASTNNKRRTPPTAAQMSAIAQLSAQYQQRCSKPDRASVAEMANAVADSVEL